MKLMVDGKEVCHFCGNPITQPKTGGPRRFCCEKCRREWWKAHPEAVKKARRLPTRLYVSSAGSLSFPMETRTENTAAVNVISGTDF